MSNLSSMTGFVPSACGLMDGRRQVFRVCRPRIEALAWRPWQ